MFQHRQLWQRRAHSTQTAPHATSVIPGDSKELYRTTLVLTDEKELFPLHCHPSHSLIFTWSSSKWSRRKCSVLTHQFCYSPIFSFQSWHLPPQFILTCPTFFNQFSDQRLVKKRRKTFTYCKIYCKMVRVQALQTHSKSWWAKETRH